MKLLIISAGPGMDEIRDIYGHAIDWISSFLNDKSLDISINHIYKNENFNHSEYDAWIITGSASSVLDSNQWISTLKDKIIYAYNNSIPILGICFGHQIISSALGGKVEKNKKGWELGSFKVNFNRYGRDSLLFKNIDFNDYFYFSHEDIVLKLPQDAIELASNNMGLQSYSINNKIYGVQFHPEFSLEIAQKYVQIRYNKGIISSFNHIHKSKTSYKVISNFIDIVKENY